MPLWQYKTASTPVRKLKSDLAICRISRPFTLHPCYLNRISTMPSHTVHGALVKLHFSIPGAPWNYDHWKDATGVYYGLFPSDDSKLPRGWTRENANHVESYFDQFNKKTSEDEKIRFAARKTIETIPGRAFWQQWVNNHLAAWDLHARITAGLQRLYLTPLQLAVANGQDVLSNNSSFLASSLDKIGLDLFGPEALDRNGLLKFPLRDGVLSLVQRTWENLKKQVRSSSTRLEKMRTECEAAVEGTSSSCCYP